MTDHWVGELTPNEFSGCCVPALPSYVFPPHFQESLVEVKASGPPHILKQWLGVSKGMLPVKYIRSNKASLCQLTFLKSIGVTTLR